MYFRKIFKNIHFYFAILLGLAIFSPVLIWNYQHAFISFKFQLSAHNWGNRGFSSSHHGLSGVLFYVCSDVLGVMHIWLILPAFVWIKNKYLLKSSKNQFGSSINSTISIKDGNYFISQATRLPIVICITYFMFWLVVSPFAHVAMNYLLTMDSIIIILGCYYLCRYKHYKTLLVFACLFLIISTIMLIMHIFMQIPPA